MQSLQRGHSAPLASIRLSAESVSAWKLSWMSKAILCRPRGHHGASHWSNQQSLQHRSEAYAWGHVLSKKRHCQENLNLMLCRTILCRTSHDMGSFTMVTGCRSSRHVNFRFEKILFKTVLCRGESCPLPLALWASAHTFLLLEASEIVMRLHAKLTTATIDYQI